MLGSPFHIPVRICMYVIICTIVMCIQSFLMTSYGPILTYYTGQFNLFYRLNLFIIVSNLFHWLFRRNNFWNMSVFLTIYKSHTQSNIVTITQYLTFYLQIIYFSKIWLSSTNRNFCIFWFQIRSFYGKK